MVLDTPRQLGPQMLMNGTAIGWQLAFAQCVRAFSWFLMMASMGSILCFIQHTDIGSPVFAADI